MNEIIQSLYNRKSVRAFLERPIPEEHKDAVLRAAFEAPTAGNQMMYTIIDVMDQGLKDRLAVTCDNQPFIAKAPMVLIFVADCQRWFDTYKAAGLQPRTPGQGDILLAVSDACIAAQNAVAAAESLGIGSCYIGDILEHCEEHTRLLNLPEYVIPAAMLVFSYPTEQQANREKPKRFRREYIVFTDKYQRLSPEQHREMYERREKDGGKAGDDFEERITAFCKRKYESDFALEMNRSASAYLTRFASDTTRFASY